MAITSRKELEAWLKDKPADWAQVIAARAALRALPYAYVHRLRDEWVKDFSHSLFRITSIFWAVSNVPTRNMAEALHLALRSKKVFADSTGYEEAGVATYAAIVAIADEGISACDAVTRAIFSAARDGYVGGAVAAGDHASESARAAVWQNITEDCDWLQNFDNPEAAAQLLTCLRLNDDKLPRVRNERGQSIPARLLTLDPTYQVWIDWYNRRIEGHQAAFDIPGDSDRTEDKKILARLADATDEDFWSKGATYVNTALQGWIDEARERVRPRDAPFVTDPLRQLDAELQSLIDEAREQVTTQGKESAPEPQNADVIQFRQTETGQFDPDFSAGSDELLTDQAACDRHRAFVTTARDALLLCRGHNQIGHVAEHLTIVIDAAGDQPRTMRVDLLVARGERMVDDLRDAINELQPDPEVALGNLQEKRIVNVFNALIRDYTAMIKLDPSLDRRQRLPHYDEENASAVSPQQALIFVNSSVTVGAITQSARDVIVENAVGVPENGDINDRRTWRFSEIARNLPRAMIGVLRQHRGTIARGLAATVAGLGTTAITLITQEAVIRSFFATNPGMLLIIDELVGIIRGIGM